MWAVFVPAGCKLHNHPEFCAWSGTSHHMDHRICCRRYPDHSHHRQLACASHPFNHHGISDLDFPCLQRKHRTGLTRSDDLVNKIIRCEQFNDLACQCHVTSYSSVFSDRANGNGYGDYCSDRTDCVSRRGM